MLESFVTRMESTYLTRIDFDAQRQLIAAHSSEMQIPEGFSVPWNDSLCEAGDRNDQLGLFLKSAYEPVKTPTL